MSGKYTLIEVTELKRLRAELEAAKRDAREGWNAFYRLRQTVAADKYPALTNVVRTAAMKDSK